MMMVVSLEYSRSQIHRHETRSFNDNVALIGYSKKGEK